MATSIEASAAKSSYGRAARSVTEALEQALRFLRAEGTVSVALVSDAAMRRVNRERRGKDESTTVLSFAERESNAPERSYLGEILLAPDTVRRRGEDVVSLAVHGLLHLLGYTHDGEDDSIEMERTEAKVLQYLESHVPHHHRP